MNPISRFKPLDHLPLSPGVCLICSGSVGPFIDTSRQLDFEGAVYICLGCVSEMAAQLGLNFMLNAEEVKAGELSAYESGVSIGRLEVMRQFSEFVSSHADRSNSADADVPGVPDDNPVEASKGAEQDKPEPRQDLIEGDGPIGIEEFGVLPGNPSDGDSLFSFTDR